MIFIVVLLDKVRDSRRNRRKEMVKRSSRNDEFSRDNIMTF